MEHAATNEVLRCEHLCKSFFIRKKEFRVLTDINLGLQQGEVVLVTGRSGTGKTTLLSLMCGLEPATEGEIFWDNRKMSTATGRDWAGIRQNKIGIIFQNYNLITSWTAYENVEAPLLFRDLPKEERQNMVRDIMRQLGILSLADNKPAELSEGQQQRVAVARTVVTAPLLIMADEPTGGVDPETGEIITATLLSLVKENNSSLLIASHGGTSFAEIADKVFLLENGMLQQLHGRPS